MTQTKPFPFHALATIAFVVATLGAFPEKAEALWSGDAHDYLIDQAFPDETEECREHMKEGSKEIDSIEYQTGGNSYLHAMRNGSIFHGPPFLFDGRNIREAKEKMYNYVEDRYGHVRDLYEQGRNNLACNFRGQGLHPVMDMTSPSHEGFQDWFLVDLSQVHRHGDMPGSEETLEKLLEDPERLEKTVNLMIKVDTMELNCEEQPCLTPEDLFGE